jgi:transcriptional regulator with XRE-family HTH domain
MRKIIGARLEEEREKLGKKKGEMAAIGGVAASAYTNYLEGNRAPDAEFLAGIAAAGADVQYILTGIRSNMAAEQNPGYTVLNQRETMLLDNYRHITDEEDKRCVERTVLLAAKATDKGDEKSGSKKRA